MKKIDLPEEKTITAPALIWKRIGAFLIDILILNFFVLLPFGLLIQDLAPKNYGFQETISYFRNDSLKDRLAPVYAASSIISLLYFYLMEYSMGQTIGKRIFKIYVAGDNKFLKRWQVFVRNIIFIPFFPFMLLLIIDPVFMVFTKTNQRLSEILSKTKVMEKFSY